MCSALRFVTSWEVRSPFANWEGCEKRLVFNQRCFSHEVAAIPLQSFESHLGAFAPPFRTDLSFLECSPWISLTHLLQNAPSTREYRRWVFPTLANTASISEPCGHAHIILPLRVRRTGHDQSPIFDKASYDVKDSRNSCEIWILTSGRL